MYRATVRLSKRVQVGWGTATGTRGRGLEAVLIRGHVAGPAGEGGLEGGRKGGSRQGGLVNMEIKGREVRRRGGKRIGN